MCLSANKEPVKISATTEGVLKVLIEGKVHHAFAYSMTLDSNPAFTPRGNMIMVAVRAKPDTIKLHNIKQYNFVFGNWASAIEAAKPTGRMPSRGGLAGNDKVVVVKNYDRDFDVLIAHGAKAIPGAIAQVSADRLPEINTTLFEELDVLYPKEEGWHILLFCFKQAPGAQIASCLLTFEPVEGHEDDLIATSLDGHEGIIERGNVELDHTVFFGSHELKGGVNGAIFPQWSDRSIVDKYPWIDVPVRGHKFPAGTSCTQGDFIADAKELAARRFCIGRVTPPGWNALPDKPVPWVTQSSWRLPL